MVNKFEAMRAMANGDADALLKVLIRYKSLTATQAARFNDKTPAEMEAVLAPLVEAGVVGVDSLGNYSARRAVINDVRRSIENVLFASPAKALAN